MGSNVMGRNGILGISDFLGRRVSVGLLGRVNTRFGGEFTSGGVGGVLAVRTSNVKVTYVMTRRFSMPIMFTGGSRDVGLSNRVCMTRIRSFARGYGGGIVISRGFLSRSSRMLVVSSFLTGKYTLRKLVRVIRSSKTAMRNVKVTVRGKFRSNKEVVHGLKFRLRSLTVISKVSTSANRVFFERRGTRGWRAGVFRGTVMDLEGSFRACGDLL